MKITLNKIVLVIVVVFFGFAIVGLATYNAQIEIEKRVREIYRHPDLIPEIHEVGYHYVEVNLKEENHPVYLVQVSKTNLSDKYDGQLFNIYVNVENEYVYWELD